MTKGKPENHASTIANIGYIVCLMTPLEAIQIKSLYSYISILVLLDSERPESIQQLDILEETESLKSQRDHEGHIWLENVVCLESSVH